ncbi:hypothetical protein SRABI121_02631 [Microbacterium sp. Bi121]|nr:hypothetical protein SRABI121_02631 [Microbacterium sp. Bi121]
MSGEGTEVTESALREREDMILEKARAWGLGVEGGQLVDDLQLLADLQHFGVPTRLIDLTSNPMTALWFASQTVPAPAPDEPRGSYSASGVLLAINMPWYNEAPADGPVTVFKTVGQPPVTFDDFGGLEGKRERGLALDTPFIVSSSMPNPRLRAQEGYFIASAHPTQSTAPLTSLQMSVPQGDPDEVRNLLTGDRTAGLPRHMPFVAIFVKAAVKAKLLTYLRMTYSRTAKILFPDYTGFTDFGEWKQRP